VQYLANQYGVNLSAPSNAEDSGQDYLDPVTWNEVQQVKQTVQGLVQQTQQTVQQQYVAQVEAFAAEANPDGTPKRPYFQEVAADMTRLAALERANGRAVNLESLYQDAVRFNPTISARLQEAAKKREEAETAAREREAVAKAKKAAFTGRGGADRTPKAPPRELRDHLREALDAALAN